MKRTTRAAAVVGALAALATTVTAGAIAATTTTAATTTAAGAVTSETVPIPTVTGPIAGQPVTASPVPLPGYTQQEYFVSGRATGYVEAGDWGADGRWSVAPASSAPYETRMLVRRPADPRRFSGTVVVEWLDVPGGVEVDPDFLYTHAELVRAGDAWVGVTTLHQGAASLQARDPARYAALSQPGDSYSYSIYSQAAQLLRHPGAVDPLGGLRPRTLIGDGYSGASFHVVTYIDALQPVDRLFDGFLVHSRKASAAPISVAPQPQQPAPPVARTRTDLDVPVLTVETETEILAHLPTFPGLDYVPATQPDTNRFRLWEAPGTAHVDATLARLLAIEIGGPGATPQPCALPPNDGQESALMDAALAQLTRWIRTGVPAPSAPRITLIPGSTPTIARDADGNALGGIRTPALQAPTGTLTGSGNSGPTAQCDLEGTTTPFSPTRLHALYPTRATYLAAVTRAAANDVAAGFLLPADATTILTTAHNFPPATTNP
ncbi:MAG: alpha/beta hydrolase domain-containing protein [Mycobacteriales bacterium]